MTANMVVCRLCLERGDQCVVMDEMSRELLEVLEVKMNLDVSKDPAMCKNCLDIVKKLLFFKSECIETEEMILLYRAEEKKVIVDLKQVYKHNNAKATLYKGYDICRLCMKQTEEENYTLIDTLMNLSVVANMFARYMSDTNLNTTENPIVCIHCRDKMKCYFKFIQDCLDTEEKINTYKQNQRVKSGELVILDDVLQYLFKGVLEVSHIYAQKPAVKQEIKIEQSEVEVCKVIVKNEKNFDLEFEGTNLSEYSYDQYEAFPETTRDIMSQGSGECYKPELITCETVEKREIKSETKKAETISEAFDNKTKNRDRVRIRSKRSKSLTKNCYQPINIKYENNKLHGCIKKIITYRGTRRKGTIYVCKNCEFETKYLASIRDHNISCHKAVSEVKMYKCGLCDYESKLKKTLKKHIIRHLKRKTNNKRIPYKKKFICAICNYETNVKYILRAHILRHMEKKRKPVEAEVKKEEFPN